MLFAQEDSEQSSPVADLGRFERVGDDDYRQRMINNVLALALTLALMAAGIWIADTMASIRNHEDCVLAGGRNCAPVEVPVNPRS